MRQRRQPGFHAEIVEPLLERRGIHHTGADFGGDRFPDPRREQHEGRRDLAEIMHHGFGLLDEVDLHPAQQPLTEHVNLFHDPGQRQHRDVFVVRALRNRTRDRSAQCRKTRPAASIASFGLAVVPDVVQRMAQSSPFAASTSLS